MFFLYNSEEEHPLDVVGWFSQDDVGIQELAEKYPGTIYFEGEIVTC